MYQNRNQNQLGFRVRGITDVQSELESSSCILLQRERWFSSKLWKIDVYSRFPGGTPRNILFHLLYYAYSPHLNTSLLEMFL